ncbi:MAG: glycosyltransferase [Candidatus Acidiferrum sp.]
MRLAILMSVASPWSREAAVRLAESGHEIHVISFRHDRDGVYLRRSDSFLDSGMHRLQATVAATHLIDSGVNSTMRYLLSAPMLRRILKRCEADVLLTLYGGGFAVLAFASGFRPYAVYVVGSDILDRRRLKRGVARIALRSASAVFVNGAYLAEKTRELIPNTRPMSLYLGVDTERFSPRPRLARPVRIVCTRGFLPVYNNEYLIRALARIRDEAADFTVTFVSGGPLLDSSQRLADELLSPKVRSRVEFLGGVSDERLTDIVRESHIYISTSRSDGTSSSLLEALASGLFPIISDIPQNREWVTPNGDVRNGILVPLDEPETLARALQEGVLEEQWRNGVAEYNRSLVLTRANSRRNMATLAATLASIVQKPEEGEHEIYNTNSH